MENARAAGEERRKQDFKRRRVQELRAYLETYKRDVQAEYGRLAGKRLPALTEELFALFEKTGDRLKYEHAYFGRRRFLTVAGMHAVLFGKQRAAGPRRQMDGEDGAREQAVLEEILRAVCRERCWALPAHVDPGGGDGPETTVDLFAAETAQTLSELASVLGTYLSEEIRRMIRGEVLRRVLRPFMSRRPYSGWETEKSNWNAVCCGSVGAAAYYLLRDGCGDEAEESMLRACLERVRGALACYPGSFSRDGACMEGLGYWEYGMGYYVMFAVLTGDEESTASGLLSGEKFRRMMEFQQKCFFAGGRTLSFSDGDSRGRFRVGLASKLAELDGGVRLPPMERALLLGQDPCWRWAPAYRDWVWTEEYLAFLERDAAGMPGVQETKEMQSDIFPDAQWAIFQGRNQTAAAVKGGHNGEPHNHNDVGSFQYFAGGEELICDLGAGEYTKEYFSRGRYEILCNSSEGHSVPIVGGALQLPGEDRGADCFEADGPWKVAVSFAGAYGKEAARELWRRFEFDPKSGELTVEDRFVPGTGTGVFLENLVTMQRVEAKGSRVFFEAGGSVTVEDRSGGGEPGAGAPAIRIRERTHTDHAGIARRVFLIQWEVPFSPEGGRCVFRIRPGRREQTPEE